MQETTYWFVPKYFGWGFMPVTIEGWLATLLFLAILMLSAYINGLFVKRDKKDFKALISKPFLRFYFDLIILIALFTVLFANKVEGGLQWRWLGL